MDEKKLNEILDLLLGVNLHEWRSIEHAVNMEFSAMSNRLELTDVTRIQKIVSDEIIR